MTNDNRPMKVELINFTGIGMLDPARFAAEQLIFTKSTRLEMSPTMMEDIADWPAAKILEELRYMANTIPSSWEFVDYTFLIRGVTRAFTHQLVRTRTASFAQQTMRVLNVSSGPGWGYLAGPTVSNARRLALYDEQMRAIDRTYRELIADGCTIEDARGVLPTNILTNIVMKINMRNFVELVRKRSSGRVQGEYRDFLEAAKKAVRDVHPWIDIFIDRTFDRAAADLEAEIAGLEPAARTRALKLIDQMRAQS